MDERFMEQLVRRIDEFVTACGIQPSFEKHARGDFAQALFGYNHGMGAGKQASSPFCCSTFVVLITFPRSRIDMNFTTGMWKRLGSSWAAQRCSW
jgi:hypothetical protein